MNTKTIAVAVLLAATSIASLPTATAQEGGGEGVPSCWYYYAYVRCWYGEQYYYCGTDWEAPVENLTFQCTQIVDDYDAEEDLRDTTSSLLEWLACKVGGPDCAGDFLGYFCYGWDEPQESLHVVQNCGGPRPAEEYVRQAINIQNGTLT